MEAQIETKRYRIPQDLIADILRTLFRSKVRHKIIGVKERENVVILELFYSSANTIQMQARMTVEDSLLEYMEYMEGLMSDETLFMDEDEYQY